MSLGKGEPADASSLLLLNFLHQLVDVLVQLGHISEGKPFPERLGHDLFDSAQLCIHTYDQRIVLQLGGDLPDLGANETQQLRLAQDLAEFLVVILGDHSTHHLGAADPAAQANENDQVLVAM